MFTSLCLASLVLLSGPAEDKTVLVLKDGRRIAGQVERQSSGYRVKRGDTRVVVADQDVQRWLSRTELLQQFAALHKARGGQSPFGMTQRAIWAFENGLDDRAWPLFGKLLNAEKRPPSIKLLEQKAARLLIDGVDRTRLVDKGRQLLLACRNARGDLIRLAKNHASSIALQSLLELEKQQAVRGSKARSKAPSKLLELVRKYADDAIGTDRRDTARRTLLTHNERSRRFVYRLAARNPEGSTRQAILAEVENHGLEDAAASYLSGFLRSKNSLLRTRSVEVLGALGSTTALPALRKARKDAIARLRKRASGAGSPRSNISVIKQKNYIADFDVEVAANAAIAKPVIRTAMEGVVLDVRVVGASTIRFYTRFVRNVDKAIRKIEVKD